MKNLFLSLTVLGMAMLHSGDCLAQRQHQTLGRGVVVAKNGSNALVTWRRLAQEPEDARYNVYVNGSKINSMPLKNTNMSTTSTTVPAGSSVTVTMLDNSGRESAQSVPYKVEQFDTRSIFVDINYEKGGSPLSSANYNTSYVWPVDLDGDGEMDYVVNRMGADCYVEGYLRTGEHLWTVKVGPNELFCSGQDDQICAFDIDCDGKGEVIMQTSDGTQFWDPEKKTFGLYVNGSTSPDTDGDGISNYETQNVKNPPKYMTVIDGMTGKEKVSVEQSYNQWYNRNNKASLMGDEYNKHVGHVGIFYHDGIHPAIVMEWHIRGTGGDHHYCNIAFAYDFVNGKAQNWHELFNNPTGGPAFHQIRIGDTDGDGCDEMIVGGYTMNNDGTTLFNTGISHGDRFRTSDIDPERPGLETFAIQQYAGDMLGQILYDAATGEPIKKWYLSAVGDVGRGECMDIDQSHLGWEMWSTMGGVYDAKGNLVEGVQSQFPCEGIWWDGELDRENVGTSDSHYNVYIQDFFKGREIEIAKMSNYRYLTVYAKRAAFWGDIIGDWREELILRHLENGVNVGITGFTTDYSTTVDNIYCLLQDPHYMGDCTTKGYYQSPNPGFYLGYDMPRPQLPPCMVTDLIATSSGGYTDYDRSGAQSFQDGKSILFDLSMGTASFSVNNEKKPSVVYAMPVKGQNITLSGSGSLAGTMEMWKSQQGTLTLDSKTSYTGKTVVTEGTVVVNGDITSSTIDLRARGTVAGKGTVGNIIFEGALNYEGCRIQPEGTITFAKGLNVDKRVFAEFDSSDDLIHVDGDLKVTGSLILNLNTDKFSLSEGEYKLIEFTGNVTGEDKISVMGVSGLSYNIKTENNAVSIVINHQREASEGVVWMGSESDVWDYNTNNFLLGSEPTGFVAGDAVIFNDEATVNNVVLNELLPADEVKVNAEGKSFTFSGTGGITGNASLVKEGNGTLNLSVVNSDYTGKTIIKAGTVVVNELADAGIPSSIGAAGTAADNIQIGNATLSINNGNTATNRGITLTDSAKIHVNSGATSLKGIITGPGTLVKTGSGQLNITYAGNNTWTGGTVLNGGTLAMGTWNTTFGAPTSTITANGGSILIFDNNSTSAVPSFRNTLYINEGKTVNMYGGSRCAVAGKLMGEGTLKISFPYVRGDYSTNMSDFFGKLVVTSGQFRMVTSIDMSNATFSPMAGVYVVHCSPGSGSEQNYASRIGALESDATDCSFGSGVWNVGYLGTNTTFAGVFASSATLNKYGEGKLTLSGASSNTINIYEGSILAENSESPITSGNINIKKGGTLMGNGMVKNVSVENGGTLSAGRGTVLTGELLVKGSVRVNANGIVKVRARSSAKIRNDEFNVDGTVTMTSPVFEMEHLNGEWKDGDEMKIFTGTGKVSLSGTPSFIPAMPAPGCRWDYSRLASEGVISVVADPTGIGAVATGNAESNVIYDLSGRRIPQTTVEGLPAGTYIVNGKRVLVK